MQLLLWLPVLIAVCCIAAAFIPVRKGRVAHPVYTTGTVVGSRRQTVWKNRSETESLAPVVRFDIRQHEHILPDDLAVLLHNEVKLSDERRIVAQSV